MIVSISRIVLFVSLHCCKGDTASQREMTIWGCQNSVTPESIDYKFDKRDYVGKLTSYAEIHNIR